MGLQSWSKSEVEYGRKILNSGLEGARSGREAFLDGRPLTPFFSESVRKALAPAAIGACLGILTGSGNRGRSAARALVFGLLGSAVGFGAGMIWASRPLTASVLSSAVRKISRVRDERWLQRHPIDYA